MNRRSGLIVTAGLFVAALSCASAANAAGDDFCRDYARTAVRQARAVIDSGRCDWVVRDGSSARWSTDWRAHFNWCLGASYDKANSEREIRHRGVDRCMHRDWDRDERDRDDRDRGDRER